MNFLTVQLEDSTILFQLVFRRPPNIFGCTKYFGPSLIEHAVVEVSGTGGTTIDSMVSNTQLVTIYDRLTTFA